MSEEAKYLETARADRFMWLMKCPTVVSRAWQEAAAAAAALGPDAGGADPNPDVAKVILSLDPLRDDDTPSQAKVDEQFLCLQSGGTERKLGVMQFVFSVETREIEEMSTLWFRNVPQLFHDFVPMCIFSESNQGKVENKFDMKLHRGNLMDYGRLCRERTNMSMVKIRRTELILDDNGKGMRPMTGNQLDKKKPPVTKPINMKRTRMDRGQLENKLFNLFER
uniref:Transcription initiation factor IIF subunit beta n=1 Tax=Setaria italica TaxID=4555 RepID=K3XPD2_SETIT